MKDDQPPLSDFSPANGDIGGKDSRVCQSIEWYSEGEMRIVDVDGVKITVRFVCRRGRRGRISITAPPGTRFSAPVDRSKTCKVAH